MAENRHSTKATFIFGWVPLSTISENPIFPDGVSILGQDSSQYNVYAGMLTLVKDFFGCDLIFDLVIMQTLLSPKFCFKMFFVTNFPISEGIILDPGARISQDVQAALVPYHYCCLLGTGWWWWKTGGCTTEFLVLPPSSWWRDYGIICHICNCSFYGSFW